MTPYLAVIRDSYREALSSRVLWILLVVITLALAGLVPFGWRRQVTTGVRLDDLPDARRLAAELSSAGQADKSSPAKRIWSLLPDKARKQLTEYAKADDDKQEDRGTDFAMRRELCEQLNRVLERDDFFQEDVWRDVPLDSEARELIDRGPAALSVVQRHRLNRLALEAALPGHIRQAPSQSVVFHYLVWDMGEPVPLSDETLREGIAFVMSGFVNILMGSIGVMAAIVVTASIIPNMFDAGSVALLLSKPISRPLLFLAKFLGGCWFVLINAAYLIGGLWLVLGLRLGYWQHRLLWCIPLFLFLFAVYYSVSALAGLVWRNAVVAVMVTVLFWLTCVAVGGAKYGAEMIAVQPNRLVKLLPADDQLLAISERGRVLQWDSQGRDWQQVLRQNKRARAPR